MSAVIGDCGLISDISLLAISKTSSSLSTLLAVFPGLQDSTMPRRRAARRCAWPGSLMPDKQPACDRSRIGKYLPEAREPANQLGVSLIG